MHMDREQGSYVHRRREVENTIEELIALLDEIDGDPDTEVDNPREEDDTPEEDDPAEPSLGAPERHDGYGDAWGGVTTRSSQMKWADGSLSDRELTEDTLEGDPIDEKGELDESDLEPDQEDGDGEFSGRYRYGADEEPLGPLDVEVLTVVRGPSRLPRKRVERPGSGFSNVTIIGPRWW